ncbi:unnamed protein product [Trichobilharzia szidati]|nr:unnamed protein product [Trichobilharzia szidati]
MTSGDAADNDDKQKTPLALPTQPYCRIHCRQSAVRAARFNADGNYCMTAGGDKTIKLWNPYNCRLLKTYTGHGGEVSDVQAGKDNSQLGSGGADCLVMLWDVATGQSVRRWRRHAGRVNSVLFISPFYNTDALDPSPILLSTGVDGMVLVWDARARTPYPVQTMHEARDSVTCCAFRRNQIVTGSVDRCVRTYDIRRGEMIEDYIGYPITSVSITLDSQCFLVGTQDSTLRLFDALTVIIVLKSTLSIQYSCVTANFKFQRSSSKPPSTHRIPVNKSVSNDTKLCRAVEVVTTVRPCQNVIATNKPTTSNAKRQCKKGSSTQKNFPIICKVIEDPVPIKKVAWR